jgi:hypothetical protein
MHTVQNLVHTFKVGISVDSVAYWSFEIYFQVLNSPETGVSTAMYVDPMHSGLTSLLV